MDGYIRNFGDALPEVIVSENYRTMWTEQEDRMIFPIGSVIVNSIIEETLDMGVEPVFVSCGWRGEPLNNKIVKYCTFLGSRGPKTAAELERHGVNVKVTYDPAYETPEYISKSEPNGLAIVVRHILDPSEYTKDSIHELKADKIYSPVVEDENDIIKLIEAISGARFVLAGSMHAAIVAHAYKVPFALLGGDYIDCPPKWEDWFSSINLGKPVFVKDVVEGREWYQKVKRAGK